LHFRTTLMCHVCGLPTNTGCVACFNDFHVQVPLCGAPRCVETHEQHACPQKLRMRIAMLMADEKDAPRVGTGTDEKEGAES